MAEPPKPPGDEQGEEAALLARLDQEMPSLLDVALGNMEKEGKVVVGPAALPSRVVVLGRTPPGDAMTELQALIGQCRAEADAATEKYSAGPARFTGVIFAFTCGLCLFSAELPTRYMFHFLAALEKNSAGWDAANPLLTNVKVLSATDDIPYFAFQDWHTAVVAVAGADPTEFDSDDAIVAAASEVNLSILSLADRLSDTPLETMVAQSSGIPHPATLAGILAADGAPTLQEFLDMFATPVFVDLDSEKTWPVPQPLKL